MLPHPRIHYSLLLVGGCDSLTVIVCQTIALVVVSTFGINMGPFYAVLGIHLYLLIAAEPYVHLQTGRSMRLAVQCLLLTSFVGLTFQQTSRSTTGSDSQQSMALL